uniref:Putative exonuclease n=1 Tax=viral metagenome TaxID=1070528 RepID=A0A6M3LK60_9ZZZZ
MLCLVYDTETTGMADFNALATADHQPNLVQYAGVLADDIDGRVIAATSMIVLPRLYKEISPEAEAVHGVSVELAEQVGRAPQQALGWHQWALERASVAVAHNIGFDRIIMAATAHRLGRELPKVPEVDTMKGTINLVQAKPRRYGSWKWPTLQELHRHLFGCGFLGAHDALVDVQGLLRCYVAIRQGMTFAECLAAFLRDA